MKYRTIGKTGLSVSEIGLGSYLTYGQGMDEQSSRRCIEKALECGINFFDTADSYGDGEAERILGRALKKVRDRGLVIATKCYHPFSDRPEDRGLSRRHIREAAERSLRNLQVESLDLLQCHRFDPEIPLEETVGALSELAREGKIRCWGVSQWTAPQIREAVRLAEERGQEGPVSDQAVYHLLQRGIEAEILPVCRELGIGILAYAPLAQGALTGKYLGGAVPSGSRASNPEIRSRMVHLKPEDLAKVGELKPLAEELGVTLSQLALGWCLSRPVVSSAITGATRPEQIEENVKASGLGLPEPFLRRIDEIAGVRPAEKEASSCGSS